MVTTIDMNEWDTCKSYQVPTKVKEAMNSGRWLFIWDKPGVTNFLYSIRANLCSFGKQVSKKENQNDALKSICDAIVDVQRNGGHLMIDLDKENPNFYSQELFKPEIFCSETAFCRGELPRHKPKQEIQGDDSQFYSLRNDYSMVLRSAVQTERELWDVIYKIPYC